MSDEKNFGIRVWLSRSKPALEEEGFGDTSTSPFTSSVEQKEDPIPNGGLVAWLQVLGSFFLFLNTWGLINSYGVFQTYYEVDLLHDESSSAISWIGSVQSFVIMFSSIVVGPLFDAGYFKTLVRTGTFLVCSGHMMLSICDTYWQVFLAQAICVGLGAGALFVPTLAILPTYFTTRMSIAIGIAASGSSLGGVIYPILLHRLLPRIGFGWAVRVIAFFALFGLLISSAVMRVRVVPSTHRKMLDLSALKQPTFVTFTSGILVAFLGLYVPFYYVQLFAIDKSITNENIAFYFVPIINGASLFGRILPNLIADRFGALNILLPCAFLSGVMILCLLAITSSLASLVVICAIYGFVSGTFVSLMPSVIVALTPNKALVGTRMGMYFMLIAFSLLFGTPIGGAVLGSLGYHGCWIYGGVMTIAGAGLMSVTRSLLRRDSAARI